MDKIVAEWLLESWRVENCPHFPIFIISERDLGPSKEVKDKLLSSCISFIPESNFSPKWIPRKYFIERYLDKTLALFGSYYTRWRRDRRCCPGCLLLTECWSWWSWNNLINESKKIYAFICIKDLLRYSVMLYHRKNTASPMLRNTTKNQSGRVSFLFKRLKKIKFFFLNLPIYW